MLNWIQFLSKKKKKKDKKKKKIRVLFLYQFKNEISYINLWNKIVQLE